MFAAQEFIIKTNSANIPNGADIQSGNFNMYRAKLYKFEPKCHTSPRKYRNIGIAQNKEINDSW